MSRDALNTILVMRFSATGELEPLSCPSARLLKSPASSSFPSGRRPTLSKRCGRCRALVEHAPPELRMGRTGRPRSAATAEAGDRLAGPAAASGAGQDNTLGIPVRDGFPAA